MEVTLSRIRARILNRLHWPYQNWHFVQTVSDICFGRVGWFPYGHLFLADEAGWINDHSWYTKGYLANESAVSQRVRRALLEYERAELNTTYRLFEWKRGGGASKAVTQYGHNHLNDAALWIQSQLRQVHESVPSLIQIDELITGSLRFLPRVESKKLRSIGKRKRKPPQRYTQPTSVTNPTTVSALSLIRDLGVRIAPTFAIANKTCGCKVGENCARPGKHPRIRGWLQHASRNESVVCEWFEQKFVPANFAILTGERLNSGGFLTVLDVDRRNFGFGTLRCLLDEEPDLQQTFTVTTGDGIHYYYASSDRIPNASLGKGIDVQGVGGYVLGPGSSHLSGRTYTIEKNLPIAPLPATLVELLVTRVEWQQAIPAGERHKRLRAYAYAMALKGHDTDTILQGLQRMRVRCAEGQRTISDAELRALAESAVKKVRAAVTIMDAIVA